ncbi:MAG: hypothetical protein ACYS0I_04090 [Planctomycetota bacterium]
MSLWPDILFQPSGAKRECLSCGEPFELGNPAICTGVNGLIFGSIMVGLSYIGLRYEWLRVLSAGFLGWIIHPFIVWIFGRWRSRSYRMEDFGKAQTWARISCVSGWVFGIATLVTVVGVTLLYRNVVMELTGDDVGVSSDAAGQFAIGIMILVPVGAGVAFTAILVGAIASNVRGRLRNVEKEQEL